MATIDEELNQLEKDIRQLKVEYDQYFGGGRKRPPTEIEWRIELVIKRYVERGAEMSSAQRFRSGNLTQTYAKYKDVFRKRLQQKEEGTVQHHFGAAAKAIEAERAERQAQAVPVAAPAAAPAGGGARAATAPAFRITCSDPERETEKVERLYDEFLRAKRKAGESVDRLNRDDFRAFVSKKTGDLKRQKGCKEVEYVVETTDGQVKLKALVKT
jgi:hypothetical protein